MLQRGLTRLSEKCLDRKWFQLLRRVNGRWRLTWSFTLFRMLLKKELSLQDWEKAIKEVRAKVEMDEATESGLKLFE